MAKFNPGTYEGSGRGYGGKLFASVTVSEDRIEQVEALEHESDVALTELGALLFLELADLRAEKFVGASGRVVKKAEDVQKG